MNPINALQSAGNTAYNAYADLGGALVGGAGAVGNMIGGAVSGINHMLGGNLPRPGGGETPSAFQQAINNVNDWLQQHDLQQRSGANLIAPIPSYNSFATDPALMNYYAREGQANAMSPQTQPAPQAQQGFNVVPQAYAQGPVTPTTTIPQITPNTMMIMNQPVATAAAQQYIANIMNQYHPSGVPAGWTSPLATPQMENQMAQTAYNYRLHPGLLPLLSIAETQALRPGTAGANTMNPFNVQIGGQDFNYNQPQMGLGYAINKYGGDIAQDWTGQGWTAFRQNPTLQNLIYQGQNPIDHPSQEMGTLMNLSNQFGIGGKK